MGKRRAAEVLTVAGLRALKPRERVYEIPDAKREGLWVRVHPSGSLTFCFRYRHGGRWLRKTYRPRWPRLSLTAARARALQDLAQLDRGEDPRGVPAGETVADLVADFRAMHLPALSERSQVDYVRIFERDVLPALGPMPAASVSVRDVVRLLDDVGQRGPVIANRVRAVVSSVFTFGRSRGLELVNPVSGTQIRPERRRRRYLKDEELREIWRSFAAFHSPVGDAVLALAATGQRTGEVRAMRWEDLQRADGMTWWVLPTSKNQRPHAVPVTPLLEAILARRKAAGGRVVFESRYRRGLCEAAVPSAVRNWQKGSELAHWTPHDLRRTFETGLARLGVPQEHINRCLNHAQGGMAARYNVWEYREEKLEAFRAWDAHLAAVVG